MHASMGASTAGGASGGRGMALPRKAAVAAFSVDAAATFWDTLPAEVMEEAMEIVHTVVRHAAAPQRPLVVELGDDGGRVVFSAPLEAVAFALKLQVDLLSAPWPEELLELPSAALERSLTGSVIFCGPRLAMGLHWGGLSGRDASLVRALAESAWGGQVLATESLWHKVDAKLYSLETKTSAIGLGPTSLTGWPSPVPVFAITSEALVDRRFGAIANLSGLPVGTRAEATVHAGMASTPSLATSTEEIGLSAAGGSVATRGPGKTRIMSAAQQAILRQIVLLLDRVHQLLSQTGLISSSLEKSISRTKALAHTLDRLGFDIQSRKQAAVLRETLGRIMVMGREQGFMLERLEKFIETSEDFESRVATVESQFSLEVRMLLENEAFAEPRGVADRLLPPLGDDAEAGMPELSGWDGDIARTHAEIQLPKIRLEDVLKSDAGGSGGESEGGASGGGSSAPPTPGVRGTVPVGVLRKRVAQVNQVYTKYIRKAQEKQRNDRVAIRALRKRVSELSKENEQLQFRLQHGMTGMPQKLASSQGSLLVGTGFAHEDSITRSQVGRALASLDNVPIDKAFQKRLTKKIAALSKRAQRRWSRVGLRQLAQSRRIGKYGPTSLRKKRNLESPEPVPEGEDEVESQRSRPRSSSGERSLSGGRRRVPRQPQPSPLSRYPASGGRRGRESNARALSQPSSKHGRSQGRHGDAAQFEPSTSSSCGSMSSSRSYSDPTATMRSFTSTCSSSSTGSGTFSSSGGRQKGEVVEKTWSDSDTYSSSS
ncbi:uncharacterized protein AMSG_09572 [Thecamonas trahens ATCC 50062]|uniref:Uncharacterized protein n=1 Tax=Thecamonas trahens ATCC 50062 TaxID=461836 RepID=A0A0L0DNT6_THETB|nr:hypothetical protein AMSG_09572 [Thecamonas trahens ATCC 50062]KNC53930.1 hypothetical protein AMSG_09572 [Thecamonas trahens ATCC 50062]|eukprot:XP_013754134.1 hypothetical protein AMSG_09572 [Thecamonas trahens ATCC 50062]